MTPSDDSVSHYDRELTHMDPDVRWIAVTDLEEEGGPEAVRYLIRALRDPEFISIRWRSAMALGNLGDHTAVEPLIAALGDENDHVREEAADALGRIGDPRAVSSLITALKDPQRGVRLRALSALVRIGDAAKPALENAMGSVEEAFARLAREALDDIQKKDTRT
ncbi:HEAT repeat protein [Methanolinea mesophila]|uniref:HEAT repeat domain-containing protein n=1 Tax=Methanolinea mesophila TaxID=547055 RepID=UPI001AE9BF76|nr:HEAT repeat domain-containing protein [Methanolinea mesophila]MBP1928832.1 HEAT repeat protein [Methanolinea mesophila]